MPLGSARTGRADELDADDVSSSTIWSMSSTHHVATVAGVFPAASDRRRTGSDVPARRALDVPSRWRLTLKMGIRSIDVRLTCIAATATSSAVRLTSSAARAT
jgi:hypothetical protein